MGSDGYKTYAACALCRVEAHRRSCVIVALNGSQRRVCYVCIEVLVRLRDEKSAALRLYDALIDNGGTLGRDNST